MWETWPWSDSKEAVHWSENPDDPEGVSSDHVVDGLPARRFVLDVADDKAVGPDRDGQHDRKD